MFNKYFHEDTVAEVMKLSSSLGGCKSEVIDVETLFLFPIHILFRFFYGNLDMWGSLEASRFFFAEVVL